MDIKSFMRRAEPWRGSPSWCFSGRRVGLQRDSTNWVFFLIVLHHCGEKPGGQRSPNLELRVLACCLSLGLERFVGLRGRCRMELSSESCNLQASQGFSEMETLPFLPCVNGGRENQVVTV